MTINRRNILLGLGAIVGGGGALVGTGAFSTVSAARTVNVETAGDADAFLQIQAGDAAGYLADQSGNTTVTVDLDGGDGAGGKGFNENAITTINSVLKVANNASTSGSVQVGVSASPPSNDPTPSGSATITVSNGTDTSVPVAEVTFYVGNDPANATAASLAPGDTAVDIGVTIDTTKTESEMGTVDDSISLVASRP